MTGTAPVLEVRRLAKSFGALRALDGVDLTLHAGEVHALLGENGAGKSTLIRAVTGVSRRDSGTIHLDGVPIDPASPEEATRAGIATVYQEVNLLPNLSVAQNLFLGREPTRLGLVRGAEMRRRARALLAGFDLAIDVSAPLGQFPVAVQHIVAIARAVDLSARVLILDEPTASLDEHEVAILFAAVRRLQSRGLGVLFVTHFLDQVYALCDRITVLRNGCLVGERATAALPRRELVEMMLGRALSEATHERPATPPNDAGPPLASFEGVGKAGSVAPFDLRLRRGRVVGLAGLLGSGRTETARLVFGADRADGGRVTLEGRPVRIASPRQAIRHGFGFCPEERKTEGIVAELTVRENIVLALQARRGVLRPLSRREQDAIARRFIALLDIRPPDPERPIGLLSGGNQQKALLARALATDPRLLVLDEPTRGIDVGAHAEVIRLVRRLCAEGLSLLVISSELEEIVTYADEVVVLRERAHVAWLAGASITVPAILAAIAGDGPVARGMSAFLPRSGLAQLGALAAILLLDRAVSPQFFDLRLQDGRLFGSAIDVLNRGAPVALLALGMTPVIASRGIDLSVGAVMAICGAIAATLADAHALPLVLAAAIGAGLLCGLWNGLLVAVLGIQPIVATLILMVAGRGIAQMITGGRIVTFASPGLAWFGGGTVLFLPASVALTAGVLVLMLALVRGTALGLLLEATGGNARASLLAGVGTRAATLSVYAWSGVCAALAGIVVAADIRGADANNAGLWLELDAILAVVIGGMSLFGGRFSLVRALLGALVIQAMNTGILLAGFRPELNLVVKAVVVIAVLLVQSPRLDSARQSLGRRGRPGRQGPPLRAGQLGRPGGGA